MALAFSTTADGRSAYCSCAANCARCRVYSKMRSPGSRDGVDGIIIAAVHPVELDRPGGGKTGRSGEEKPGNREKKSREVGRSRDREIGRSGNGRRKTGNGKRETEIRLGCYGSRFTIYDSRE